MHVNKLLGHFPMVCVKVTHKLTAVVQMICVNVCVAQNNAFHPVIVNDQKHCLFFLMMRGTRWQLSSLECKKYPTVEAWGLSMATLYSKNWIMKVYIHRAHKTDISAFLSFSFPMVSPKWRVLTQRMRLYLIHYACAHKHEMVFRSLVASLSNLYVRKSTSCKRKPDWLQIQQWGLISTEVAYSLLIIKAAQAIPS